VEFIYNNSHQATIEMARYEALYNRKCRTPLYWEEVEDKKMYDVELIQVTIEKVKNIKDQIKAVQDRQNKFIDTRRRPLKFITKDKVFLKVAL
jgi:hypothetical protein